MSFGEVCGKGTTAYTIQTDAQLKLEMPLILKNEVLKSHLYLSHQDSYLLRLPQEVLSGMSHLRLQILPQFLLFPFPRKKNYLYVNSNLQRVIGCKVVVT